MSQQTFPLNDVLAGASRKRDAKSAKDAARTCNADAQKGVLQRELMAALHGRTCPELEAATGIPRYIIASRLAQMRRMGLCEPFGYRRNERGRSVQVWNAVYQSRVVTVETNGRL